jgi:acetylglutamate kinase
MSNFTAMCVGGYDLSDDESAELIRLQMGKYEPVVVYGAGDSTENTASTVEPELRQLFSSSVYSEAPTPSADSSFSLNKHEDADFSLDVFEEK